MADGSDGIAFNPRGGVDMRYPRSTHAGRPYVWICHPGRSLREYQNRCRTVVLVATWFAAWSGCAVPQCTCLRG